MASDVRIYVEGGRSKDTKGALQAGFREFFRELRRLARKNGGELMVIACTSRSETCRFFEAALSDHADSLNVLLVDSEGRVNTTVIQHLRNQKSGCDLRRADEDQCHLMVQKWRPGLWLIRKR
jgi:hypothetical protein